MTVYEGNDVQLSCILSRNYPVTEISWYNNQKQHVNDIPLKYVLERASAWTNLTVRETDSETDSGQYWCSATNAVGGAEIPIMLMVKSKQTFKVYLTYYTFKTRYNYKVVKNMDLNFLNTFPQDALFLQSLTSTLIKLTCL